jgi:hypothetical protein
MQAFARRLGLSALVMIAAGVAAQAADTPDDRDAPCRIPFEVLKDPKTGEHFPLSAALNETAQIADHLRQRYVVADLSTAGADGMCRGVREHFSQMSELSEFPRLAGIAATRGVELAALAQEPLTSLAPEAADEERAALALEMEDLKNYLQQVHRYKTNPIAKPPVFNGYCVGQTLNLCEVVDGKPRLVFRFVTSSSKWSPPLYRYYAPINTIASRNWSSDRRYTPADARRDARMGGGAARTVPFANDGEPIEMPNFLHFLPMPGYTGQTGNGIHQIAGGLDSGGTFGAPVSLGCLRLGGFQSKAARWWTPTHAKLFVHFEPNQYRKFGIASTRKARGFQVAKPATAETPVMAEAAPVAPRTKTKPPRASGETAQRKSASSPFWFLF